MAETFHQIVMVKLVPFTEELVPSIAFIIVVVLQKPYLLEQTLQLPFLLEQPYLSLSEQPYF